MAPAFFQVLQILLAGFYCYFTVSKVKSPTSVSYRNFLYSNEQLIVIARSVVTKQSHKNDSEYD
jgi:hypothetical protein